MSTETWNSEQIVKRQQLKSQNIITCEQYNAYILHVQNSSILKCVVKHI